MRYLDANKNIVDYGNTMLSESRIAELELTPISDDYRPPKSDTQIQAEKLEAYKQQRSTLLTATDRIFACSDYTVDGTTLSNAQRTELSSYRQALRDAPEKYYPNFPVKPSWLP